MRRLPDATSQRAGKSYRHDAIITWDYSGWKLSLVGPDVGRRASWMLASLKDLPAGAALAIDAGAGWLITNASELVAAALAAAAEAGRPC